MLFRKNAKPNFYTHSFLYNLNLFPKINYRKYYCSFFSQIFRNMLVLVKFLTVLIPAYCEIKARIFHRFMSLKMHTHINSQIFFSVMHAGHQARFLCWNTYYTNYK
jgi:hypothetical protein